MVESVTYSNRTVLLALFSLLILCASPWSAVQAEDLGNYRFGAGDVIKIQVYGEPELSMETVIRDRGVISYPFLGEIQMLGLTVGQLERKLAGELSAGYLIDPKVTVTISQYRKFFVNGQVQSPGGYSYQPEMTVRKALTIAGGITDRGSYSNITLVRDSDPSKSPVEVGMDAEVNPGDILTVEESFF